MNLHERLTTPRRNPIYTEKVFSALRNASGESKAWVVSHRREILNVIDRVRKAPLLSGREYLNLFMRIRAEIDHKMGMMDYDGVQVAYDALAEYYRPIYYAIMQLKVSRADEQKKLAAIQKRIAPLRVLTQPGWIQEREEDGDDLGRYRAKGVVQAMSTFEEIARYLAQKMVRVEEYRSLEQRFDHGPFSIVNSYGFKRDEYAKPLATLDEAAEAIRSARFDSTLYGDVHLIGNVEANVGESKYAGLYVPPRGDEGDLIKLNVETRKRFDDVYTLIHEFGHRHWFVNLSDAEREAYTDAYDATAAHLTVADRDLILNALIQTDFSATRAARLLPPAVAELAAGYVRERAGKMTQNALRNDHADNASEFRDWFVQPKRKRWFPSYVRPQSVTEYGRTNVREDYAEVFAHVVLGRLHGGAAYDRFMAAQGERGPWHPVIRALHAALDATGEEDDPRLGRRR